MRFERLAGSGTLRRGPSALVVAALTAAALTMAALTTATLTGGGPAVAAARPGGAQVRPGTSAAGTISTIAGGVGGPARATQVALWPTNVSFSAGHLYISDISSNVTLGSTVRSVNAATDALTTPAGTGARRPLGDGGPADRASLFEALAVVADSSGNLLIADSDHARIRMVAAKTGTFYGQTVTAGDIYTVAGGGTDGLGDGGPATRAELSDPSGAAVDASGNLLIADTEDNRIRVVATHTGTFYGQAMTAGDIYTVAGNGTAGFSGDGGPATQAKLDFPTGVAVDANGNLLIADAFNERIRVVAATTGTFYGQAMTAGHIYTVAGNGTAGFSGDGGPATSAELNVPNGVAVDAAGNLVIADTSNNRVRVVAAHTGTFYGQAMTAGDIYTVAGGGDGGPGDGGPATSAELDDPTGVAVDANGNLVIADFNDHRVRVVAASTGTFYRQAMTAHDIYTVAGTGAFGFSGDGGSPVRAELTFPAGVGVDAAGNLLIGDAGNNRVRVSAKRTGTFYGHAMKAGHIYTVAGNGTAGFSGDGGPATGAELNDPTSVKADPAGNLLIGDARNNRLRVVAAHTGTFYGQAMTTGHIYTIAGTGKSGFSGDGKPATKAKLTPWGVAVDAAGNLVIADPDSNRIRVIAAHTGTYYGQAMKTGDIYTVAGDGTRGFSGDGGPATSAELKSPSDIAVDAAGNLVINDFSNNRIRVVAAATGTFYGQAMTAGDIYTVAGGGASDPGDGGPATSAELIGPEGVTVDANGNLAIGDAGHNRVRVVAAHTGTFYGQAMKAGDIYTIAGTGPRAFSGDGGPGTKAELFNPAGLAADGANLVFADLFNNRVRMVTG
jgi:trimeric autotransporter adhesin